MEFIKKIIDRCVEVLCIILMALMTLLVTYQVITRYFFNQPSAFSEILAKYMFIWLVLFGAAYVFGKREHMNISFVKDSFPAKVRIIVEMIGELVIVLFGIYIMIIGGWKGALRQMHQMDSSLHIPMGVIYGAIPAAGCLMIFYFLYNELYLFKQFKTDCLNKIENKGEI